MEALTIGLFLLILGCIIKNERTTANLQNDVKIIKQHLGINGNPRLNRDNGKKPTGG